jgi:hypothetical protein
VQGPAICLMILAGINVLTAIGFLFMAIPFIIGATKIAEGDKEFNAQIQAQMKAQGQPAQAMDTGTIQTVMKGYAGGFVAWGVLGLLVSVVLLIGALKMKSLRSYGMAMTASVLAMIPCTSPCCLLGLPFGIWALVVLMKADVKSAFS